jgi:hypothetical protein
MIRTLAVIVMVLGLVTSSSAAQEIVPHAVIGVPVFAADGVKVGEVADVSTDEDGKIDLLRVATGLRLGLGERQIIIPRPAFMIRGRTVMLPDLSAVDVEAFPDAPSDPSNLRREE